VGLEPLAFQEAFANLLVELLRCALQALLVDRVGVGGQDVPLRLERLREVGVSTSRTPTPRDR
jgi:hypothetical protein